MSFNNSNQNYNDIVTNSDIDLESLFSSLNITENNMTQPQVMATAQLPVLKPEFIKMIPEFNGESELLPRFIEICEKLVNRFYNQNDLNDFQNEYLMSSIRSRIKGDAALNISNCQITNWNELKLSLAYAYADKRDAHTLCIELSNLKQNSNESPFDYYNKIQKMLNLIQAFFKTHYPPGEEFVLSSFFSTHALRVLLRGLREPIGSLMRTKNPVNMNQALSMLTNDFQLESGAYISQKIYPKANIKNQPPQRPNQKMNTQQFSRNFGNQNYVNYQNQNFQPRPNYSNYQNISKQNFNQNGPNGAKQKTYQMASNVPSSSQQKSYEPTPMSISTRNTFRTNTNGANFANFNRPRQNLGFISEELFNVEEQSENVITNEENNFLEEPASDQNMNC